MRTLVFTCLLVCDQACVDEFLKFESEQCNRIRGHTHLDDVECDIRHSRNASNRPSHATCTHLLDQANTSFVFVRNSIHHAGLINQIMSLAFSISTACHKGASLAVQGFKVDAHVTNSPVVSANTFVDVAYLNQRLSKNPWCQHTVILPRYCVAELKAVNQAKFECRPKISFGQRSKEPRASEVVQYFQFNRIEGWTPYLAAPQSWRTNMTQATTLLQGKYNAIHLNLDCDWLLYLTTLKDRILKITGSDAAHVVRAFNAFKASRNISGIHQEYCTGKHPHVTPVARWAIAKYIASVRHVFRGTEHMPIVIATHIGKRNNATQWVLDEFMSQLPEFSYAVGRMTPSMRYRELAALAELYVVCNAVRFIGLWRSTFSGTAATCARANKHNGEAFILKYDFADFPPRSTAPESSPELELKPRRAAASVPVLIK